MNEEIQRHLAQAAECMADAQVLYDNDRSGAVVARAYYGMFHAATAALLVEDIRRRSHHGLLSVFGEQLVRTGRIDRRFFEHFREAFEHRQQTDYEPLTDVDRRAAQQSLDRAVEFIDACARLIG